MLRRRYKGHCILPRLVVEISLAYHRRDREQSQYLDCQVPVRAVGVSREKLTSAAAPAAQAANTSDSRVPPIGNTPNISATIAAPVLWPSRRDVACMPLAA